MKDDYADRLDGAQLKAKARLNAFKRKYEDDEDQEVKDFKSGMLKIWMQYPEIFQGLMQSAPEQMNRLIQKYVANERS